RAASRCDRAPSFGPRRLFWQPEDVLRAGDDPQLRRSRTVGQTATQAGGEGPGGCRRVVSAQQELDRRSAVQRAGAARDRVAPVELRAYQPALARPPAASQGAVDLGPRCEGTAAAVGRPELDAHPARPGEPVVIAGDRQPGPNAHPTVAA